MYFLFLIEPRSTTRQMNKRRIRSAVPGVRHLALLVGLVLTTVAWAHASPANVLSGASQRGVYKIELWPEASPVPISQLHNWEVLEQACNDFVPQI